jgi:4-hydroxybenzoate polyprenyltransferase
MMSKKIHFTSFLLQGLKLVRIPNLLLIALNGVMTYFFIIKPYVHEVNVLGNTILTILTVILTAAAGYVINDYYDIKIDYINKPQRVVIGRLITRRLAIALHTGLNVLALVLAMFVSKNLAIVVLVSSFALWAYANQLKRTLLIGNVLIAALTGLSTLIMYFAVPTGYFTSTLKQLLLLYSLFAFILSFIREVIKDMEDMDGDARYLCKTLPIVVGIRNTKIILLASVSTLVAVLWLETDHISQQLHLYLKTIIIPLSFMLAIGIVLSTQTHHFRKLSNLCKWMLLTGVVSMFFI